MKSSSAIVPEKDFPQLFINKAVRFGMVTHGRTICKSGWTIGPRTIDDHLIYYLEKGALEGRVGEKTVRIDKERLFWMQPGLEHRFAVDSKGPEVSVLFFRFFLGRKQPVRLKADFILREQQPELHPILREMLPGQMMEMTFKDIFLRCQMGQLCCRVLSEGKAEEGEGRGLKRAQRKKALSFIEQNLSGRFTLDGLADHVGLHPDYFSRRFRESFGMPPQDWIKRERIRLGCSYLLESGLSVTEIAYRLGYEDLYFFSRQFKEVMGVSPVQWQQRKGS